MEGVWFIMVADIFMLFAALQSCVFNAESSGIVVAGIWWLVKQNCVGGDSGSPCSDIKSKLESWPYIVRHELHWFQMIPHLNGSVERVPKGPYDSMASQFLVLSVKYHFKIFVKIWILDDHVIAYKIPVSYFLPTCDELHYKVTILRHS